MTNSKTMTALEREFLKVAASEFSKMKACAPSALANLIRLIVAWHGSPAALSLHAFGRRWLLEGNAEGAAAETLLRDLFGLNNSKGEE